ncbi:MAG: phage holin family protein [Muribaculaceae bacterium]|nr:phage holin family protein [Muribaculaceae bacterium]
MASNDNSTGVSGISTAVITYVKLLIEDTRLNVSEKLTRLLAAVALSAVLFVFGVVALIFVALAVSFALADVLSPIGSFIIMAGFFAVMFVILILCRRTLLVNPIARFISRLLLEAPVIPDQQNESSSVSQTP